MTTLRETIRARKHRLLKAMATVALAGVVLSGGLYVSWADKPSDARSQKVSVLNANASASRTGDGQSTEELFQEIVNLPVAEIITPVTYQPLSASLNRVEVALTSQADRTLAVNALLNGKALTKFVIDTGASYTVITPKTASRLGIDLAHHTGRTVPITTANGVIRVPLVTLRQVNLGGMELRNVDAVVIELGPNIPAQGLLGMNFFADMELIVRPDKLILSKLN